MINRRLDKESIYDLVRFSKTEGFPYELTEESASLYCTGKRPVIGSVQTYGIYDSDEELVSVMTASFLVVFPHTDSPSGRIVQISGAFTHPAFRGMHYATELLKAIENDAIDFGADYICCDSTADDLYIKFGFETASDDETRLWKRLKK